MKKPTKILLQFVLYGIAIYAIFVYSAVRYPLEPALEATQSYERTYVMNGSWPFVASYLLYKPVDYDPTRKYPLVLSLHGASKRSYEAHYLAQDQIQGPPRLLRPDAHGAALPALGPLRRPGSLSDLRHGYAGPRPRYIRDRPDPDLRHRPPHGGVGTFAAMAYHAHIFAADVAVNGFWPADEAKNLAGAKLWVFHGEDDQVFPLKHTQDLLRQIAAHGQNSGKGNGPKFTLMKGIGHRSQPAYDDPALWDWLFKQRLGG